MGYKIDHLVVACNNLEEGSNYVQDILNLKLGPIGYHKSLGTYNRVLKVGSIYIEVIALDPFSEVDKEKSFFGLSYNYVRKNILTQPRLVSFVISSTKEFNSPYYLKKKYVERGKFRWNFSHPNSKKINKLIFPYPYVFPSFINWVSNSPILEMENNELLFDSLIIELDKDQGFYKEFLNIFDLKEKIFFKLSSTTDIYKLPRLTAKIINSKDNIVIFIN